MALLEKGVVHSSSICWRGSLIKSVGSAHGMQIKDLLVELIPSRPKF